MLIPACDLIKFLLFHSLGDTLYATVTYVQEIGAFTAAGVFVI